MYNIPLFIVKILNKISKINKNINYIYKICLNKV